MPIKVDIVIYGAGIAGLWAFHTLKALGYNVLLLEKKAIGGEQTIASQGIIHSGLKYALSTAPQDITQNMRDMPSIWQEALNAKNSLGKSPINLENAHIHSSSQSLLIPKNLAGDIVKTLTQKALNSGNNTLAQEKIDPSLKQFGFSGSVVDLQEPVLDIPSVVFNLAKPYEDCIKKPYSEYYDLKVLSQTEEGNNDRNKNIHMDKDSNSHSQNLSQDIIATNKRNIVISAKKIIYTAAQSNLELSQGKAKIQKRPLLMGMIKNAPFPLFAHCVGTSSKPIATITTHYTQNKERIWYIGGQVAERKKESPEAHTFTAIQDALDKYLPKWRENNSNFEWASLPIDRVEEKKSISALLPSTPSLKEINGHYFCWPSKLAFAPVLSDMILEKLKNEAILPSHTQSDFSALENIGYAKPPWEKVEWKKEKSEQVA